MEYLLQSARLELRPCADTDVELLLGHWTEPAVRRYLFDDRVIDRETVEKFVIASAASFQQAGYGLWLLADRTDGEFRGVSGVCETVIHPDLLFSIAPSHWGQGLATESARCILQYVFDRLKVARVMATVDKPHVISVGVLEKLGMTLQEERLVNGNPLLYYALTNQDYRAEDSRRTG